MELREIMYDDVEAVYTFGEQFYKLTPYAQAGIEYDRTTIEAVTRGCIDTGVALMVEDEGRILGIIMVPVYPFLMNMNYLAATEWVFFIDPTYRKKGVGKLLLEAAEQLLHRMGVKIFTMVNIESVAPEKAARLYERQGFQLTETTYMKELN